MESQESTQVPIPKEIVYKIHEHIRGTEFKTVSEYVAFVLREVLGMDEKKNNAALSPEEEAQVKETLKKLGYL